MKFTEVLDNYYVAALGSLVGFQLPEDGDETINVYFNSEGQEYEQYFNDQEIIIGNGCTGSFTVIDVDGNKCQFTALHAVDLKDPI